MTHVQWYFLEFCYHLLCSSRGAEDTFFFLLHPIVHFHKRCAFGSPYCETKIGILLKFKTILANVGVRIASFMSPTSV